MRRPPEPWGDDWDIAAGTFNQPDGGPAACAAQALHLLRTRAYFADRVDWPTTTVQVDSSRGAEPGVPIESAYPEPRGDPQRSDSRHHP